MLKILVINDSDGNDFFEAEGDTLEDALFDALTQLGYSTSEMDDEEEII